MTSWHYTCNYSKQDDNSQLVCLKETKSEPCQMLIITRITASSFCSQLHKFTNLSIH